MELLKKNVRLSCIQKKMKKMKTVDEDVNLSETKCDISKIICSTYDVMIEGIKTTEEKEAVRGYIEYDILYLCQDSGKLEHLNGKSFFEENFETDNTISLSNVRVTADVEDFTVKIINSRKVNIKALLEIVCTGDDIVENDIVVDTEGENVLTRKENMCFSQIKANCDDVIRIKEDVELPKNKPNVQRMIFSDVRIKSRESRVIEDGIYVKGDIGVFVIYESDQESQMNEWYETALPFEGKIEINGVNEDMFSFIMIRLVEPSVTLKPDYDGEERVFGIEGIIQVSMKIYSEEEENVVWDMYSTCSHTSIECENRGFQQMVLKNSLKARGYNKYQINGVQEKPLQICYSYGNAHIENAEIKENELVINGYADITVIYIAVDDASPMSSFKCQVPFAQTVALNTDANKIEYILDACIDQINASMTGGDEIEVRVFVGIDILIMNIVEKEFITDATMTPMTGKELSSFPGIIGYIATSEETLWDIAKRYKTTTEKIKKVNKWNSDIVKRGDKLLITR